MALLNIEYLSTVNYSLVNNKIPLCQSFELKNNTNEDLHNVVVECSGDFIHPFRSSVYDVVKARKALRPQEFDIVPDAAKVAVVTEKIRTSFTVIVWQDALTEESRREVMRKDYDLEVMPYDYWLGTTILPQSLASFVTPNHPAIDAVVIKAAQILKQLTGSSAFTEYQTGNPNEVVNQVAAIYGALHAENIVYRSVPASYEEIGQRITLPDQVLTTKLGDCIDLAILFASVLENVGINSGIVIQKGHAYLAVWLVDDCCQYSVCDDSSYLEKKCSKGIGEMLVLECTNVTSEKTSFEESCRTAERNLADLDMFSMFIDIRRCRLERVLPLPQRIMDNGAWVINVADGVEHDQCILDVKEHSRYDLSKVMESKRELTRMDIWERKLLDFSLRNAMLNMYLRQKAIQFISFDVNLIEDYLQEGKEYRILPKPNMEVRIPDDERLVRSKMLPELHDAITNDIQHFALHTYYAEGETRDTLKNIYRAARNAIEETGANSLYLAIGTLRWFETDVSEKPRYAPILMLPVDMVYKKGEYYIRTRDEEVVLNVTLIELLRQNYDITIPGLSPLPSDEHGVDVSLVFTIIREALKSKKHWDVEEEAVLGVFSFSKFLMWNDIHNHRDELLQNDVVRSLVEQRLTWKPEPLGGELKASDKNLRPEALALPVPVDSSQMAAVVEAGKGHSFILYGPPGTGKSQTITNLIANALFQGKRVLFVAEKMAALSVVQSRLEKIGLGPFCLEMHSNKVTKRHVLDQMAMALGVTHIVSPQEYKHTAELLYEQRVSLIEYMEALHNVTSADGFSLYDCILRYEGIEADALDVDTSDETLRKRFSQSTVGDYQHLLGDRLRAVLSLVGQPSENPLLGFAVQDSDLATPGAIAARTEDAKAIIGQCLSKYAELAAAKDEHDALAKDCTPDVFGQDAEALYQEWRSVRAKWFLPRFFAKRAFMKKLRQWNAYIIEEDVENFLAKLSAYLRKHAMIADLHSRLASLFDMKCADDELPAQNVLAECVARIERWQKNADKARDWYQWCAYKLELHASGLDAVAEAIESRRISGDSLGDAFLKALFMQMAKEKICASPVLRTFEGSIFNDTVARYKKLTSEFQMLSQKELYARLAAQIPRVTDNVDSSSEIGLLNRNISNGGRGLSLRDLMDQIPTLLPRLCPCMLMSPMSVAQFLTLSQDKFDLVIFDEASQMPTSEAVGAIARGKALVVVGDPKQMPPTSFFSSTNVAEDEADIDDMESILEDCRTLEIPSLQLSWHYRSKHESLIAFSNNEYYDGSLITFPSVDDQATKVSYVPVDGVYDKGGRRSNKAEAEAIVKEVVRRLETPEHAERSIGIIAFSVVQQNLIEDLLQEELDRNPKLREAADEIYEPIFVKNLENVQGDERDIVLFSIGYGPDKNGNVSMNFGPLNNAGGERRLNVAVSRARREMMVFSTLKSSQIDLRRSKARGVEGLKHFLEYAEQQVLVQPTNTVVKSPDSVISEQIAAALREKGYVVNSNVGRSNFKVDVAISDGATPDVYSLGILLDGKAYFNTDTTRDREIVQPSVLESLNWRIVRVWSVDWINNPQRVLERIEKCLAETPKRVGVPQTQEFDISNEVVDEVKSSMQEYKAFSPTAASKRMSMPKLVAAIVAAEQPMTFMYLCRQVAKVKEMPRVTPTLITDVTAAIDALYVDGDDDRRTVWMDKKAKVAFNGYRQNNGRDITEIPMVEIEHVILEAITEQFSISVDSLSLIAAKKLGFTRRGTKVELALNTAVENLVENRLVEIVDGKMHILA